MDGIPEIARLLSKIQDPRLIEDFLMCMLTDYELYSIAGRWKLVKLLDQGMSQRQIAQRLNMSLCKITRGSRELKRENSAFRRVLDQYVHPKQE